MGILGKLFKKSVAKNKKAENNLIQSSLSNDLCKQYYLRVYSDLTNLLWIGDGEFKNYNKEDECRKFTFENVNFEIKIYKEEPSVIFLNQPVEVCEDFNAIEKPGYFPSYKSLSPCQKYIYWNYLANPYDSRYDISYVFLLYYGLERYLYKSLYIEQVFEIILKLRDNFDNKSFQMYSANTLILTCLKEQRPDLLVKFMSSLDKDYEYHFNMNLYLLAKYSLRIPLNAKDVMRMAKHVEFNNTNYIRKYPDIFEQEVFKILEQKNNDELLLSNYISNSSLYKLNKKSESIYCNYSIDNYIDVPLIIEVFKLKKWIYEVLENSHENVKTILAEKRKKGEQISNKSNRPQKEILIFNYELETQYLKELSIVRMQKDILELHFKLMNLQSFYYSYRNTDEKYLQEAIKYCEEDINMSSEIKNEFVRRDRELIEGLKKMNPLIQLQSDGNYETKIGRIPAFETLMVIYAKKQQYDDLIRVCDKALEYYNGSDKHKDLINKIINKRRAAYEKKE